MPTATVATSLPASSPDQDYVRPLPYLVPKSVIQKAAHFSESYWKLDSQSLVYKLLDALCGDSGAGDLKKQLLVSRLQGSLDSTHFQDLDSVFHNVLSFPRLVDESYDFNPYSGALTIDQWDEVKVKDAKYRARCMDLMSALNNGGTAYGMRMACKAVLGVDCDIFELWKHYDSPEFSGGEYAVGRTGNDLRTEVLITPWREITRQERRNLLAVMNRLKPREAILTIGDGLQVHISVPSSVVASDSSYFEVSTEVTGASGISDVGSSWYFSSATAINIPVDSTIYYFEDGVTKPAQTPAFIRRQEDAEIYDFSNEAISTVDSIQYQSAEDPDGTRTDEGTHLVQNAYAVVFGPWTPYDLADSPDNFPGGKYGQSPSTAPALNPDGSAYVFRYATQQDYVDEQIALIVASGGEANNSTFRLRLAPSTVGSLNIDPLNALTQGIGGFVSSLWYGSRE